VTNYQIDQALDAANDQLDALIASAPVGSPARWLPDFVNILSFWATSAVPGYSFTDSLNAMGDFLNRVVPPFKIVSGADALGVITPYKIMAAAVAGTATVLTDMLNGTYDPAQWEIDAIYVTTGATVTRADLTNPTSLETKIAASVVLGLGVYSNPEQAWDTVLPTWTAEQVNPFTIVTYVALVAMYKRFQEMAALQTFTTSTTYESWIYTIDLGSASTRSEYAAGSFHAVDEDGRSVDFQVSDGATFTSEWGALVTINTFDGGYTYTATLPGEAYFHAGAAGESDTVDIPVTSADGAPYTLTFQIKIIDTVNSAPTVSTSAGSADALGVVRGTLSGSDSDGDTLTYSLVDSSVNDLSDNSAYTTNGGTVTLDSSTGAFTYVSTSTGGSSASFQVQADDGHGGLTTTTVTVPNTTSITPANVDTSTVGVVTGSVPAPAADAGMFSYALGTGPSYGTVTFDPATGAFTYTRNAAGHTDPLADSFTVIATDANGRTVTLQVPVQPTVANTAPTITQTTTNVGSTDPTKWGLNTSTWAQTTSGKITTTDADGDTLTYSLVDPTTHAATTTTTNGGTVTFDSQGNYTYTITKNQAYFHGAAKIGASGTAVNDSFTVAVNDGYGGTAYTTVTMPIYAYNTAPTISGTQTNTGWTKFLGINLPVVTSINIHDAEGDLSSMPQCGGTVSGPCYTKTAGTFIWTGDNSGTSSWSSTSGPTSVTLTFYDGYYHVTNGVVTSIPENTWVLYNSNGNGNAGTGHNY